MSLQESLTGRGKRRSKAAQITALNKGTGQETKRALYHCNYCQKDISNVPRIKCAVCPDFDLCLECFSVGVEVTPHKNYHGYRVVDNLSFPIFHPDWGADEEMLLLEALDMYGLGNWAAVSEHVGGKGAELCKQHFYQIYIDVDSCPRPTPVPELLQQAEGKPPLPQRPPEPAPAPSTSTSRKRQRTEASGPAISQGQSQQQQPQLQRPSVSGISGCTSAPAAAEGVAGEVQGGATAEVVRVKQEEAVAVEEAPPEGEHLTAVQRAAAQGLKRVRKAEHGSAEGESAAPGSGEQQPHPQPHPHGHHDFVASGRVPHHDDAAAGATAAEAPAAPQEAPAADAQLGEQAPSEPAPSAAGPVEGVEGAAAAAPEQQPHQQAQPQLPQHQPLQPYIPGPLPAVTVPVGPDTGKPVAAGADVTGYHAKRYEFDPEYDNDAECLIADLEFNDADAPEDRQRKLRMLEIYNLRLDERERRRAFILQHGLLNMRKVQALEKRRSGHERDVHARLRVFARYANTPQEHDDLVEGLLLEQRLRARIQELKECRRNGVRTLADAEAFDSERRRAKQDGGAASGAGGGAGGAGKDSARPMSATAAPPGGNRGAAAALSRWQASRGVALDISCLPGVELLSAKERELCATSRLVPTHYLALKDMMMRDGAKEGGITKQEARTYFRLDNARNMRLYELWTACGWVATGKPTGPAAGAKGGSKADSSKATGMDGDGDTFEDALTEFPDDAARDN